MADVGDSELLPRLNMTKLEKPKAKAKEATAGYRQHNTKAPSTARDRGVAVAKRPTGAPSGSQTARNARHVANTGTKRLSQAPSPVNVKSARAAANKSKGSTGRSQGSSHDSTKKMPPKHGSQASAPSAPGTASSSSRTTSSKRGDAPARAEQGNTWTPAQVLKTRPGELTEYEQGEILEYKQVYFWGNTSKKIRANTRAPNNHGFDDERGDY